MINIIYKTPISVHCNIHYQIMSQSITLCTNDDCPMAKSCWRHEYKAAEGHTDYERIEPEKIGRFDELVCIYFIEMESNDTNDE